MNMQSTIDGLIRAALPVEHLEIDNESHKHGGPGTQTHYKVVAVSEAFTGLGLVKRHQRLYEALREPLENGVHALALHTYTPQEWAKKQAQAPQSPDCMGGGH